MFDDISKTTIIQNFKKKSKYIKKNNLFEFQNESISVINEFLAYIVGFNNYKEFLSTDFSSNDSRFDLFYYRYQSNKKYLLKRTYLFLINLEKNNNKNKDISNMDRGQLNNEIDSMLLDDMFYRSSFYSDICLLEGDNKKFAYKRIDNIYDNIKHNKLIILNDFNSENSYNYLQKVIFENNNNIKDSIICNLSSLNLNNDSIKEYTGIEGWLELKNDLIKNMGARIDNEMKDVVKNQKELKRKIYFLLLIVTFFNLTMELLRLFLFLVLILIFLLLPIKSH